MKRNGDLVVDRMSADRTAATTHEMKRRAAINITGAHLRGVAGLPDRDALVDVLEMLGLTDVGEKR